MTPNETTRMINPQGPAQQPGPPPAPRPAVQKPKFAKQDEGVNWTAVTIGGVAAIMLGGGAAYAATELSGDDELKTPDVSKLPEVAVVDDTPDAFIADDSDSFATAFAEAREAQGPGGTFIWHGKLFNTYTEAEWNNMSQAERNEFAQNAVTEHEEEVKLAQAGELDPTEVPDVTELPDIDQDSIASYLKDIDNLDDIQQVELPDGTTAVAGTLHVNGYNIFLFDTDGDGTFDTAACDFDGDGTFDMEEATDISGLDQTVSDFAMRVGTDPTDLGIDVSTDDDGGFFDDLVGSDSTDVADVDVDIDSTYVD